ncbi:hypothetical protein AB0K16_59120 [Nonomuraea jabiensis]|uniref:hypothetical protein n=1 Tax=Nonomuraea jabiensis TaxID=882448 RepID=UPI00341778F4
MTRDAFWAILERTTGQEIPEGAGTYPRLGEMWDFSDVEEMRRRYPRLSALLDEADALARGVRVCSGR